MKQLNKKTQREYGALVERIAEATHRRFAQVPRADLIQQGWICVLETLKKDVLDEGWAPTHYLARSIRRELTRYASKQSLIVKAPDKREYEFVGKVKIHMFNEQVQGRRKEPRYLPPGIEALIEAAEQTVDVLKTANGRQRTAPLLVLKRLHEKIDAYQP